jgi:hypothetical protein
VRRVEHEQDLEAEVAADARGRLAAVVRRDAADGDAAELTLAQPCGEVGIAVEGGLTCFVTSRSGSPVNSGLNALPGAPGRSGDAGSSESWRTKTTGRSAARHAASSAATFASQSGLLRRPQ